MNLKYFILIFGITVVTPAGKSWIPSPKFADMYETLGTVYFYDAMLPTMVHAQWHLPFLGMKVLSEKYLLNCYALWDTCTSLNVNIAEICKDVQDLHLQIAGTNPVNSFAAITSLNLRKHHFPSLTPAAIDTCVSSYILNNEYRMPYAVTSCENLNIWCQICWKNIDCPRIYADCQDTLGLPAIMNVIPDLSVIPEQTVWNTSSRPDRPRVEPETLAAVLMEPFQYVPSSLKNFTAFNTGKSSENIRMKRWDATATCGMPFVSLIAKTFGGECYSNKFRELAESLAKTIEFVQTEVDLVQKSVLIVSDQSQRNLDALGFLRDNVQLKFETLRKTIATVVDSNNWTQRALVKYQCADMAASHYKDVLLLWIQVRDSIQTYLNQLRLLPLTNDRDGILRLTWQPTLRMLEQKLAQQKMRPVNAMGDQPGRINSQFLLIDKTVLIETYQNNITAHLFNFGQFPVALQEAPERHLKLVRLQRLFLRKNFTCYASLRTGKFLMDLDTQQLYYPDCLDDCSALGGSSKSDYLCGRTLCTMPIPDAPLFSEIECPEEPSCPTQLSPGTYWVAEQITGHMSCTTATDPDALRQAVQTKSYPPGTIVNLPCQCRWKPALHCPELVQSFSCTEDELQPLSAGMFLHPDIITISDVEKILQLGNNRLQRLQTADQLLNLTELSMDQQMATVNVLFDNLHVKSADFWEQMEIISGSNSEALDYLTKQQAIKAQQVWKQHAKTYQIMRNMQEGHTTVWVVTVVTALTVLTVILGFTFVGCKLNMMAKQIVLLMSISGLPYAQSAPVLTPPAACNLLLQNQFSDLALTLMTSYGTAVSTMADLKTCFTEYEKVVSQQHKISDSTFIDQLDLFIPPAVDIDFGITDEDLSSGDSDNILLSSGGPISSAFLSTVDILDPDEKQTSTEKPSHVKSDGPSTSGTFLPASPVLHTSDKIIQTDNLTNDTDISIRQQISEGATNTVPLIQYLQKRSLSGVSAASKIIETKPWYWTTFGPEFLTVTTPSWLMTADSDVSYSQPLLDENISQILGIIAAVISGIGIIAGIIYCCRKCHRRQQNNHRNRHRAASRIAGRRTSSSPFSRNSSPVRTAPFALNPLQPLLPAATCCTKFCVPTLFSCCLSDLDCCCMFPPTSLQRNLTTILPLQHLRPIFYHETDNPVTLEEVQEKRRRTQIGAWPEFHQMRHFPGACPDCHFSGTEQSLMDLSEPPCIDCQQAYMKQPICDCLDYAPNRHWKMMQQTYTILLDCCLNSNNAVTKLIQINDLARNLYVFLNQKDMLVRICLRRCLCDTENIAAFITGNPRDRLKRKQAKFVIESPDGDSETEIDMRDSQPPFILMPLSAAPANNAPQLLYTGPEKKTKTVKINSENNSVSITEANTSTAEANAPPAYETASGSSDLPGNSPYTPAIGLAAALGAVTKKGPALSDYVAAQ